MKRLLFFAVAACIFLTSGSEASMLLDRVVAVVNQEIITWSDLYKAMEFEARDRMEGLTHEEKRKVFKENEAAFLESLIDVKLQLHAAKQAGIEVTPEDVNDAINDIKKKYSLDHQSLAESLKKEGFTFDEYKEKLEEQMILSRIVAQQVRNKIVVPDNEVGKQMTENKELLTDGEGYRIRQIFFKKAGGYNKAEVEDKARGILHRLRNGEDFSSLAQKYSEDPSRAAGGDLGFIKKSQMAKEFVDVIAKMKKGDVSEPFWTEMGLHIIKLEEKAEKLGETELKEDIRNKIFERLFYDRYKSWLRGLRENAYIEIGL